MASTARLAGAAGTVAAGLTVTTGRSPSASSSSPQWQMRNADGEGESDQAQSAFPILAKYLPFAIPFNALNVQQQTNKVVHCDTSGSAKRAQMVS